MDILPYRTRWMQRFSQLEDLLDQGVFVPPLLHHICLFVFPTIAALLIPCSCTSYTPHLRGLAFLWTAYFGTWMLQTCQTPNFGNGYGIGILVSCYIMRSGTILLLENPERRFRRVEKRRVPQSRVKEQTSQRPGAGTPGTSEDKHLYVFQKYPQNLWHRLSWVISLLFSARGSLWNWRVTTSKPLPELFIR